MGGLEPFVESSNLSFLTTLYSRLIGWCRVCFVTRVGIRGMTDGSTTNTFLWDLRRNGYTHSTVNAVLTGSIPVFSPNAIGIYVPRLLTYLLRRALPYLSKNWGNCSRTQEVSGMVVNHLFGVRFPTIAQRRNGISGLIPKLRSALTVCLNVLSR